MGPSGAHGFCGFYAETKEQRWPEGCQTSCKLNPVWPVASAGQGFLFRPHEMLAPSFPPSLSAVPLWVSVVSLRPQGFCHSRDSGLGAVPLSADTATPQSKCHVSAVPFVACDAGTPRAECTVREAGSDVPPAPGQPSPRRGAPAPAELTPSLPRSGSRTDAPPCILAWSPSSCGLSPGGSRGLSGPQLRAGSRQAANKYMESHSGGPGSPDSNTRKPGRETQQDPCWWGGGRGTAEGRWGQGSKGESRCLERGKWGMAKGGQGLQAGLCSVRQEGAMEGCRQKRSVAWYWEGVAGEGCPGGRARGAGWKQMKGGGQDCPAP